MRNHLRKTKNNNNTNNNYNNFMISVAYFKNKLNSEYAYKYQRI